MKNRCASIVIGLFLAITAGSVTADSVGPYYATPSWDQTLPAASRYVKLSNFSNEAFLDRNTGLVWQIHPNQFFGAVDFVYAQNQCTIQAIGNQRGWRLPSITELNTLVIDPNTANERLDITNTGININSNNMVNIWSSTPNLLAAADGAIFYGIQLTPIGQVQVTAISKTAGSETAVMCVRGGVVNY